MGQKVIGDTNILIDLFDRGSDQRQMTMMQVLGIGTDNILISTITEMEVVRGIQNREHGLQMEKKLKKFRVVPLSAKIGIRASALVRKYHLSHGLDIPDALIAATAIEAGLSLFTHNTKDFRFIEGLELV